ncbi:DUF58 domain-containing protein [Natrinema marinum]|uniref:DUF58 domain-containing protein n=1 Tax=Natrinema marinum TaxID=2961598 RepID=UPI0020C8F904|nr:DUF58 domain-containing protein [Natrinema marinum]
MRLTLRGWTAVGVVVLAVAMSWQAGPRALNAVVVPLAVVVLAGLLSVGRADRPRVDRHPVREGFIGERRQVEVAIQSDGTVAATVRDTVGDGLSTAEEPITETTLAGAETFAYDVELEERGDRRVGPLSIAVSDVLGFAERRFEYEETTSVLVYPRVRDLSRGPTADLQTLASVAPVRDAKEFDHLREYRRGDALRDVHWKSAAKRPDDELTVVEYADEADAGAVTVAAECVSDRDDELASAAASVVTALLELGATVGLTVPDGTYPPGSGRSHHRDLLGLLAVAEPGELPERTRQNADVLVRTDEEETTIVVDDREIPFDRLCGGRDGELEARRSGSDRNDRSGRTVEGETEVHA